MSNYSSDDSSSIVEINAADMTYQQSMPYQPPQTMSDSPSSPLIRPQEAAWARDDHKKHRTFSAVVAIRILVFLVALADATTAIIIQARGVFIGLQVFVWFCLLWNIMCILRSIPHKAFKAAFGPMGARGGFGCFVGKWQIVVCGGDEEDDEAMLEGNDDKKKAIKAAKLKAVLFELFIAIMITLFAGIGAATAGWRRRYDPVTVMSFMLSAFTFALTLIQVEELVALCRDQDDDAKYQIRLPREDVENCRTGQHVSVSA